MQQTDRLIAKKHILQYREPSIKLLMKFPIIFWLLLFAYIQLNSLPHGRFRPFSLLILVMPFLTKKLFYKFIDWHAVRAARKRKQKTETGYFVDVTDSAKDGFAEIEMPWLDGMRIFLFVKEEGFEQKITEWKKAPDFDFVHNISALDYMSFTVLNEDLANQLQSLCCERVTDSQFDFPITKKCFARYVIANKIGTILDKILLEAGNV